MNLQRLFGRHELRSTRRPLLGRRPLIEALEERQLLTTFNVTNSNDSGVGSLRAAIISSNAATGVTINTINFQIGDGGTQPIALQWASPTLTHAVTSDARRAGEWRRPSGSCLTAPTPARVFLG